MQQETTPDCEACQRSGSCISRFQEVLRLHEGRLTDERRSMLQAVCDKKGHFLPEEIAESASQLGGRRISVTTVYRNLPLLIESGILRRATVGAGAERASARYESIWNRKHHDHLLCSRCGQQVEFTYPAIEVLQEAVARDYGFVLERHHLELVGVCPGCQANRPTAEEPR